MTDERYCGFVALAGRPNVGKSTLINRLTGQKISIVTPKAQTTRHRILGIVNTDCAQIILVDTPGIHRGDNSQLNRMMNRAALASLADADLVLFVIEALRWNDDDMQVLQKISAGKSRTILVVNKIDRIKDKKKLLPFIEKISGLSTFDAIVPIAAEKNQGLDALREEITKNLPRSLPLFEASRLTDRGQEFRVGEIIREKLTLMLQQEIPYNTTVQVEAIAPAGKGYQVNAVIWVARAGQKKIVIGKQGQMIKRIGTAARKDIIGLIGAPVHLELWVKVREKWTDSVTALRDMGYDSR